MSEREQPTKSGPGAANSSEQAARDAVRALPRPSAEVSFRNRLRQEFTTGRFGPRRIAISRPWFARAGVLVPVAAVFLLFAGFALNRGPGWQLVAANGEGRLSLDGVSYAPDAAALGQRLRHGGRLRTDGALTLDVVAPGQVAVALAPGAEIQLSAPPGRWWGRAMTVQLTAGNAYFTTGRAFHGARLDVRTPEVSVRCVGTAFAVLRETEPERTCVCVMEGHVRVVTTGAASDSVADVPEGMRRVVHSHRRAETKPILDDSMHALHRQRTVVENWLKR